MAHSSLTGMRSARISPSGGGALCENGRGSLPIINCTRR